MSQTTVQDGESHTWQDKKKIAQTLQIDEILASDSVEKKKNATLFHTHNYTQKLEHNCARSTEFFVSRYNILFMNCQGRHNFEALKFYFSKVVFHVF